LSCRRASAVRSQDCFLWGRRVEVESVELGDRQEGVGHVVVIYLYNMYVVDRVEV